MPKYKYKYIGDIEQARENFFLPREKEDNRLIRGYGMGWAHEICADGYIRFFDEEYAAKRDYPGGLETFIKDLINLKLVKKEKS